MNRWLAIVLLCAGLPAPAGAEWVVRAGSAPAVQAMLDPVAATWRLRHLAIDRTRIRASYDHSDGRQAELLLGHPDQTADPAGMLGPFAIVPPAPAADLLAALEPGVGRYGGRFAWAETRPAAAGGGYWMMPPVVPPPSQGGVPPGVSEMLDGAWDGSLPGWREPLEAAATPDASPALLWRIGYLLQLLEGAAAARPHFERLVAAADAADPLFAAAQLALGRVEDGLPRLLASLDRLPDRDRCRFGVQALHLALPVAGGPAVLAGLDRLERMLDVCPDGLLLRGAVLSATGRAAEALPVFEAALAGGREDPWFLEALAGLQLATGHPGRAVESLRRICAGPACSASVRGALVSTLSAVTTAPGDVDRLVQQALGRSDDPLAQFEAGVMLHYARRYDESGRFLDRAGAVWPADPRILIYSAMNLYRAGRQAEAEAAIERAVDSASERDADLYYCRAVIFRNRDLDLAIDALGHYLRLAARGPVPERKTAMVHAFLEALRVERERRTAGHPPRPFADPERERFGEPPGSPGAAAEAIVVTAGLPPEPARTVATPPGRSGIVRELPVLLGAGLAMIALGLFWWWRRPGPRRPA